MPATSQTTIETSPVPTVGDLLARAQAMTDTLRARADETEAARCVPAATVEEFKRADLIRMTQPRRYGGFAMGWDDMCAVAQVLAAADGAQGWIQSIMADHAVLLGTFPEQAQDDVWAAAPDAVMSASFDPKGVATPVAGGYRFSGLFGFASGIDFADWPICGGFVVDGERRDGPHFFLVPRGDVRIVDDWHTIGLEGTGSKSFEIEDAFVPEHRFLDGARARAGTGPGAGVNPEPVYRMPRSQLSAMAFAALSVGMAQGLLGDWLRYTAGRVTRGVQMGEHPGNQMVAGECAAEIAAAEALYTNSIRDAMRRLGEGEILTDSYLVHAKRNAAFAARRSLEAGTRLFNTAGGRAIYRTNALQRQYRNLMAATAHISVAWEDSALASGRDLIGNAGEK